VREYFYFDTNLYRHLIEQNRAADEAFVRKHKKRLKLTATTTLELLEDLATHPDEQFTTARNVLRFARETRGHGVLPIREEFLARRLFHTRYKSPQLNSTEVGRWMDIAVRYSSKDQIGTLVPRGPSKRLVGLDITQIKNAQQKFRDHHVEMIREYLKDVVKGAGVTSLPYKSGLWSGNAWSANWGKFPPGQRKPSLPSWLTCSPARSWETTSITLLG